LDEKRSERRPVMTCGGKTFRPVDNPPNIQGGRRGRMLQENLRKASLTRFPRSEKADGFRDPGSREILLKNQSIGLFGDMKSTSPRVEYLNLTT